jgi:hypothetical protein
MEKVVILKYNIFEISKIDNTNFCINNRSNVSLNRCCLYDPFKKDVQEFGLGYDLNKILSRNGDIS